MAEDKYRGLTAEQIKVCEEVTQSKFQRWLRSPDRFFELLLLFDSNWWFIGRFLQRWYGKKRTDG
jgi:hypothetical protein